MDLYFETREENVPVNNDIYIFIFQVIQKHSDLKRAFVAFDKKRDGYVTLDELRRVLVHFVFPISDLMFAQLMERYVMVAP